MNSDYKPEWPKPAIAETYLKTTLPAAEPPLHAIGCSVIMVPEELT